MKNYKNIKNDKATTKAVKSATADASKHSIQNEAATSSGNDSPLRIAIKWVTTNTVKFLIQQ